MDVKPGYRTTENFQTTLVNLVSAIIQLGVVYGAITTEEAQAWQVVAAALIVAALGVAQFVVTSRYIESRTRVKEAAARATE